VGALRGSVPNRSFCTVGGRDSVQLRTDVQKAIQQLNEQGGSPYYGALHAMAADCCPPLLQQIAKTIKTEFGGRSGVAAKPLVSVIMPVHNRPNLVREAIQSVLAQSYGNFELIVCDDASDDETPEVVASYRDERIRLIRLQHNVGAAAARNKCLERAQGTYISYLDSDNIWHPDFLRILLDKLEFSKALIAYASYFDTVQSANRYYVRAVRYRDFNYDLQINCPYVDLNSFVHHRVLYDCLGGFDELLNRLQDYDLIAKYTWYVNAIHLAQVLNIYRRIPGQKQITHLYSSDRTAWKRARRKISRYFKYGIQRELPEQVHTIDRRIS
jgi:glycosyltransferase involved in cell wall biosynthesis